MELLLVTLQVKDNGYGGYFRFRAGRHFLVRAAGYPRNRSSTYPKFNDSCRGLTVTAGARFPSGR